MHALFSNSNRTNSNMTKSVLACACGLLIVAAFASVSSASASAFTSSPARCFTFSDVDKFHHNYEKRIIIKPSISSGRRRRRTQLAADISSAFLGSNNDYAPNDTLINLQSTNDNFQQQQQQQQQQRDVYSMESWAIQTNGAQKLDGVELYTTNANANTNTNNIDIDYQYITNSPIASGSCILYIPSTITLGSDDIAEEFGGTVEAAENLLVEMEDGGSGSGSGSSEGGHNGVDELRLPLFRLMVKILAEYERGMESEFYVWLNSMPRVFNNGVSMTDACFECLPPYAAMLSMNERNTYSRFLNTIRQGYVPLEDSTVENDVVVKWAYNVALTRFHEVWHPTRQKYMAPLADMLNHSAEPNVEITFDEEGNCGVHALYDIQPGSALTVSLGDPTNPTVLFAKYGFLSNDCQTIFCKAVHLEQQIKELGYTFKELLFETQTGEVYPKVWDVFLYYLLQMNDPGSAQEFYMACTNNDEATKQQYHEHYFPYTLDALKNHVYSILQDVDQLTMKAQTHDLETHPRVPIIVAHNNLVRETFSMTAALLEQMGG